MSSDDDDDFKEVKSKKRKSGILAKPDEADIVKPVRFPHELLDDWHVKGLRGRFFPKLSFPNFCAGELEIINRQGISKEEQQARLGILATICYHHAYLDVSELKNQYDAYYEKSRVGSG